MYDTSRSLLVGVLSLGIVMLCSPYYPAIASLIFEEALEITATGTVEHNTTSALTAASLAGCLVLITGVVLALTWCIGWSADRSAERCARAFGKEQAAERQAELVKAQQQTLAEHDKLRDQYADFLHDLDRRIWLPSLTDLSVTETAEFVQALASANDARSSSGPLTEQSVRVYEDAVARARLAWQHAESRAAADARAVEKSAARKNFWARLLPRR